METEYFDMEGNKLAGKPTMGEYIEKRICKCGKEIKHTDKEVPLCTECYTKRD